MRSPPGDIFSNIGPLKSFYTNGREEQSAKRKDTAMVRLAQCDTDRDAHNVTYEAIKCNVSGPPGASWWYRFITYQTQIRQDAITL